MSQSYIEVSGGLATSLGEVYGKKVSTIPNDLINWNAPLYGINAQVEVAPYILLHGHYLQGSDDIGNDISNKEVGIGFYYPAGFGLLMEGMISKGKFDFYQLSRTTGVDPQFSFLNINIDTWNPVSVDYQVYSLTFIPIIESESVYRLGLNHNTYEGGSNTNYEFSMTSSLSNNARNVLESTGDFSRDGLGLKFGMKFNFDFDLTLYYLSIGYHF